MPPRERVIQVVKEWVGKAEEDYLAGNHLRALGDAAPHDVVCFHAQQCVEKYLKAILVANSLPVPKTHVIGKIAALLPQPAPVNLTPEQMRWLTEFAVDSRYPGGDTADRDEADDAMRTAEIVRAAVRAVLPAEALVKG
ncbi:MAG: HEPN domain-containing protein [Planctomycetota bacterium]